MSLASAGPNPAPPEDTGSCNNEQAAPATPPNDSVFRRRVCSIGFSSSRSAAARRRPRSISRSSPRSDATAQEALLDQAVDTALTDPAFYETMREFGREWIGMPAIPAGADEPDYMGSQMHNISQCPAGTTYAGAWAFWDDSAPDDSPCGGTEEGGGPALVAQIEPWWAPGTMVQVVGRAASPSTTITLNGKPYDCGADFGGDNAPCTCGPNLVYCHPSPSQGYANWPIYLVTNPEGQRRFLWEEPARLIAHLAWYDRPLSDVIVGDYSVGPVDLQAAYVRMGRRTGATQLDQDDSWWRPAKLSGPVDPQHTPSDPRPGASST